MIQLPQCEPLVTSRRVIERFVKFRMPRKTLGLCKRIIHRADNLPFVSYCHHLIGPSISSVGHHPPLNSSRKAFDTVSILDSRLNGTMLIKFFNSAAFLPTMAETPSSSSSSSSSPTLHPPTARSAKPVSEALLNEKVPDTSSTPSIAFFLYLSNMKTLLFPPSYPPIPPKPGWHRGKHNS